MDGTFLMRCPSRDAGGGVDAVRRRSKVKVDVDADKCVAAGQCVLIAPEVFDQREEDGIVVLLEERPVPGLHDAVRESAMVCPAAAIHLAGS
jgi:ferredoxin